MPPGMFVGLQRRGAVKFDIADNDFGNLDHINAISDRGPNDASATTWATDDARDWPAAAGDDTCDGPAPPETTHETGLLPTETTHATGLLPTTENPPN